MQVSRFGSFIKTLGLAGVSLAVLAICFLFQVDGAKAETCLWSTTTAGANVSVAANWADCTLSMDDDLVFGATTTDATWDLILPGGTVASVSTTEAYTGTITFAASATTTGDFLLAANGTVALAGNNLVVAGHLRNNGTITQTGGYVALGGTNKDFGGSGRTQVYALAIGINASRTFIGDIIASSTVTINSGATLTMGAFGLETSGAINNSGTAITQTGSSTIMNGSVNLGGSGSTQLFALTINNSNTITLAGDVTASSTVTIGSGSTLTMGGNGFVAGTTISNAGTITQTASTTVMNGGNLGGAGSTSLWNLTINGTVTLAGNVTTTNVLTINAAKSLDASTRTLVFASSSTPFVNNGTFTSTSSTVNYSSTGSVTLTGATYWNLTLGAGTYTMGANTTSTNAFTNGGTATISSGIRLAAPGTFDNNGTITETGAIIRALTSSKFTNSSGTEQASYAISGDTLYITVEDHDGNLAVGTIDTITGAVYTASDGVVDSETMTLTETGADTGIFRSSIGFTASAQKTQNNGKLEVNGNGTLSLTFTDSKDSTDTGTDTASYTGTPVGSGGSTPAPEPAPTTNTTTPAPTTTPKVDTDTTKKDIEEPTVKEEPPAILEQSFTVNAATSISVGSASHTVTVSKATAAEVTVTIQSDPVTLSLAKNESKEIDTNGDGANDLRVTYLGLLVDGKPNLKFEEIVVATVPEKEETPESTSCVLSMGKAYKYAGSNAVYYVTKDCTKRAFNSATMFFTYFSSWDAVTQVAKSKIDSIPNDALGFMPYGPLYDPQYGALVKIVKDPKVYLLLGGKRYWITSEPVFNALYNAQWNWIEDIDEALLAKYPVGSEITYTNYHPNYTLIKYAGSNKVYRLEPSATDSAKQVKRHIANESVFTSLKFRWDRIVTIADTETYTDGEPLVK